MTLGIAVQRLGGIVFLKKFVEIGPTQMSEAMWHRIWATALMCGIVHSMMAVVDNSSIPGPVLTVTAGIVTYHFLNFPVLSTLRKECLD